MRGSNTSSLALKVLATSVATATALTVAPAPASAHTPSKYRARRDHLEDRARSQKGANYRSGGSSPRTGFDCSGYTVWIFDGHGAQLPRTSREQFAMGKRGGNRRIWKRKRLRTGDLVFFKTTSARVGHVGMYIGGGKFIHTSSSRGVRIDSVWDPYYWGPRWVGATRVDYLTRRS